MSLSLKKRLSEGTTSLKAGTHYAESEQKGVSMAQGGEKASEELTSKTEPFLVRS